MTSPAWQATLYYVASALAFVALALNFVGDGRFKFPLAAAVLFLAVMGERSRRQIRS